MCIMSLQLVLFLQIHFSLSSHKNGDYDSCNVANDKNNCTICDSNKYRVLKSTAPSECVCFDGYFDAGIEECKPCHYSWFLYKI